MEEFGKEGAGASGLLSDWVARKGGHHASHFGGGGVIGAWSV